MPSEYEFSSNSKPYKGFKIEVPDCTITGNSSQFVLKDNSIMVYNLDSEGKVVEDSAQDANNVKLTKYQLSIFELLKGRDGNENDFDKDDLKGLSEEELTKLINEKFASNGVYSVNSVKLKRRSLKVQLNETINGKITIKNLEIEFDKVGLFKSVGNFFKNLFASDKPKAVIEVGDLEEVAVLPEEKLQEIEASENSDENTNDVNQNTISDVITEKIKILGPSGMVINDAMFSGEEIKRKIFTENEAKIFDLYNTNGGKKLDEAELKSFLGDLLRTDDANYANKFGQKIHQKPNLGYFLPVEMQKFLEQKGLADEVEVSTLVSFIQKVVNQCAVEKLTEKSNLNVENLSLIDDDNILAVMSAYQDKEGSSLMEDLCSKKSEEGNKPIELVKDKLVSFAEKCGVDYTDFETEFNSVLANISGKRDKENIRALDNLVTNFAEKLREKEALYKANKNGIIDMLSNKNICYSREDLDKVIDNIMKYANKYNPRKSLEEININNSETKDLVKSLVDSDLLDYYPIFVASIISHETQFLEKGDDIFDGDGRGIMQVTQYIVDDMYKNSGKYDTDFVKKIKSQYVDSKACYNAIKNKNNLSLHYETGTVALKGKLIEAITFLSKEKYTKLKVSNPEQLLELAAMHYNGNNIESQKIPDPVYPKSSPKVYVKYVYARDVISRFKHYTPDGVAEGKYYEWNPNSKKWVYKSEISAKTY